MLPAEGKPGSLELRWKDGGCSFLSAVGELRGAPEREATDPGHISEFPRLRVSPAKWYQWDQPPRVGWGGVCQGGDSSLRRVLLVQDVSCLFQVLLGPCDHWVASTSELHVLSPVTHSACPSLNRCGIEAPGP